MYVKIAFISGILLLIAGFLLPWPPTGHIDGSVLAAVGEVDTFSTIVVFLYKLPEYLKVAKSAKLSKGDLSFEVTADDDHRAD